MFQIRLSETQYKEIATFESLPNKSTYMKYFTN